MNIVSVERARLRYADKVVLDGVSVGIDEGDRVGVIGRNGNGRSTLLMVLAGVQPLDDSVVTHAPRCTTSASATASRSCCATSPSTSSPARGSAWSDPTAADTSATRTRSDEQTRRCGGVRSGRLSYNEQRELRALERACRSSNNSDALHAELVAVADDHVRAGALARDLDEVIAQIDRTETRWLELQLRPDELRGVTG